MVTTADECLAAAKRIGFPVMLKASEGGGGKGIRMSANEEELRTNFVQVQNEVPGSPMFMMQVGRCAETARGPRPPSLAARVRPRAPERWPTRDARNRGRAAARQTLRGG
jgi:hypothetical protein